MKEFNNGSLFFWRRRRINFTIDSMVRLVRAAGGEVHIQAEKRPQNKRASVYKKQGIKKAA